MLRPALLAAGLLALALAAPAKAAVIYDEAVSGDLPTLGGTLPTLALSPGANTIRGTVAFSFLAPVPDDLDGFGFSVPAGGELVQIIFSIALQPVGAGAFDGVRVSLNNSSSSSVLIPSSLASLFGAALPLGPGAGTLGVNGLFGSVARGEFRVAEYEFTLTVRGGETTAVPGPGALWPLLVGLAGLGLVRRRV